MKEYNKVSTYQNRQWLLIWSVHLAVPIIPTCDEEMGKRDPLKRMYKIKLFIKRLPHYVCWGVI